jgi:hypothetical protein
LRTNTREPAQVSLKGKNSKMYSHPLSGTTYKPDEPIDLRYQSDARYADGGWGAGDVQYSGEVRSPDNNLDPGVGRQPDDNHYANFYPFQDDSQNRDSNRYINHHWQPRPEVHQASHHQAAQIPHRQVNKIPRQLFRQMPCRTYKVNRRKEVVVPSCDDDSPTDVEGESGSEVDRATRKKKASRQKKMAEEELINALAEELAKKMRAEEKKLEAEQKEREDQRQKEMKELEDRHIAEREKALADQLAAIQKDQEEKEKEVMAGLERQAQAQQDEQDLIRKAEAKGREAEKKDAADRALAQRAKLEADRIEEAEQEARAKQEGERLHQEELKKEDAERKAAEMERQRKQKAEEMRIFIMDTKKTISELEKTILKTAVDDDLKEWQERLSRMKGELAKVSQEYNLVSDPALLEEQPSSKDDTKTGSLSVDASATLGACKGTVGQSKMAQPPKDGKRDRSSARKPRGGESRGGHREIRSKKNMSKRRKPAPDVLGWFAGESHLSK